MISRLMRSTALVLALGVSSFAAAGEDASPLASANGSEFLYQTPAKKLDLTPHLGLSVELIKYSANSEKQLNVPIGIGFGVAYGLNEMFAIGLDLAYSHTATTYTCDKDPCSENRHNNGLMDPALAFKGRNPLPKGTLRYGVDLAVGVEKHKISTSLNGNAATGGTTLTPWAGYEIPLGPGILGGKLSYEAYKGDRKTQNENLNATTTQSNGRNLGLSAFYEAKFHKATYGAALTHTLREESRTSINGASSTPNRDQGSNTEVRLYVPIQFTEKIAVLPSTFFMVERYSNSSTIDSGAAFGFNLAGRFTF